MKKRLLFCFFVKFGPFLFNFLIDKIKFYFSKSSTNLIVRYFFDTTNMKKHVNQNELFHLKPCEHTIKLKRS